MGWQTLMDTIDEEGNQIDRRHASGTEVTAKASSLQLFMLSKNAT